MIEEFNQWSDSENEKETNIEAENGRNDDSTALRRSSSISDNEPLIPALRRCRKDLADRSEQDTDEDEVTKEEVLK